MRNASDGACGRLAGLEVLRLVNEPPPPRCFTGLHEKNARVAVYDFGGRHVRISILKLISTTTAHLPGASTNATRIGGDDIDNGLQAVAREKFRAKGLTRRAPEVVQECARRDRHKHELPARTAAVKCPAQRRVFPVK